MTTGDHVLLIILTSLLSLFFILWIAILIIVLKLLASVKRVVAKAENVVESVEEAAEVLKDTQGAMGVFKLIRNIYKMANRRRK